MRKTNDGNTRSQKGDTMTSTERHRITQNEMSGAVLNTPFEIKQNALTLDPQHKTASDSNMNMMTDTICTPKQHRFDIIEMDHIAAPLPINKIQHTLLHRINWIENIKSFHQNPSSPLPTLFGLGLSRSICRRGIIPSSRR